MTRQRYSARFIPARSSMRIPARFRDRSDAVRSPQAMSTPFGKYTLQRKLAGGGMAEVFLARQSGMEGFEKLCVIKRLLPELSQDTEFVSMFLNEARLAA